MADEDFEVRGAHEHVVEHLAAARAPLGQTIALFSAVLATAGAVVSLFGGHTQTEALLYKNEAVLLKARASDQWAYYQAEDMKRHLALLGQSLAPERAASFDADVARYTGRSQAIRRSAEMLDRQSAAADEESRHALAPHGRLAIAMTALQIAIALASITALTQRRWLLGGAFAFAAAGAFLCAIAWT